MNKAIITLSVLLLFSVSGEEVELPIPESLQASSPQKQRYSFEYENIPVETVIKEIAKKFSKRVLILDDLSNAKANISIKDVTFERAYQLILYPIEYRFKEFEGGIVVIAKDCSD